MPRYKAFPRYRRPSLNTLLGITRAKRAIKRKSGFYAATRWTRAPQNFERRMLRRAGYYSGPMQLLRFLGRARKK
jgi:hypothetical protein